MKYDDCFQHVIRQHWFLLVQTTVTDSNDALQTFQSLCCGILLEKSVQLFIMYCNSYNRGRQSYVIPAILAAVVKSIQHMTILSNVNDTNVLGSI